MDRLSDSPQFPTPALLGVYFAYTAGSSCRLLCHGVPACHVSTPALGCSAQVDGFELFLHLLTNLDWWVLIGSTGHTRELAQGL